MQEPTPTPQPKTTLVSFTPGGILRVLALLAGAFLLWRLIDLVLFVLMAFIIASAILPLARQSEQHGIPRVWTVVGIFVLILGGVAVLGVLIAPVIGTQLEQLILYAPGLISHTAHWLSDQLSRIFGHPIQTPDLSGQVGQELKTAAAQGLQATARAAGAIASLILMVVLAGFMVIDHGRFRAACLRFVPLRARDTAAMLWNEVEDRMGGYVSGMTLISIEKGIVITTALWLLGVPSALLLGLLAGVLNFIPYLGFWSVFLLAELLAFNVSPLTGMWVFVLFMVHEWFKSGFLGPYLMGRAMKVHPAVVLVAITAGTKLFGIIGTLVSAPLAAAIAVIVTTLLPAFPEPSRPQGAETERRPHWSARLFKRGPGPRRGLT